MRDDVGLHDRHRRRPVGIEVHRGDIGLDHRRGPVRATDDGEMALGDRAVLDRLDAGAGDVHHDIAAGEVEAVALEPLQRRGELVQTRFDRRVHRLQGQASDRAEIRQAVPTLEALHRLGHVGVIDIAGDGLGREIAAGEQTLLQNSDIRPLRIQLQRSDARRHLGPAAAIGDVLMGDQRLERAVIGVGAVARLVGTHERRRGQQSRSRKSEDGGTRRHENPRAAESGTGGSFRDMVKECLRSDQHPSPC